MYVMKNNTHFTVIACVVLFCTVGNSVLAATFDKRSSDIKTSDIKTPVIIVPGTGGSQIEAKLNKPSTLHWYCHKTSSSYFTLWLQKSSLLPFAIDCWADNMRLVYDSSTNTVHNAPGVTIRVPGFGQTSTIEYLDTTNLIKYFKPMVDVLVSFGYERGTSVRAAPYDFRYAPDSAGEYYEKLKNLIQETYKLNGNKQVTLMTHSLGCPYTLAFLNKQTNQWKKIYIKQWIALSGIWAGSAHLMGLYASGDTFGVPLVKPLSVRHEQRTCSSNNFMLPSEELWSADEVLMKTSTRSYTVKDYDAFFKDIGFPDGSFVRRNVQGLLSPLPQHSPNVTMHCLYGIGVHSTAEMYTYSAGQFPDGTPSVTYGDGDGTVNARSLKACKSFKQADAVKIKEFPGINHNGVLSDNNVHEYITNALFE